jgi:hypothetical protein
MPPYTTRILKATALVADTKALFASWDLSKDVASNLHSAQRGTMLGKASRSRVDDVLAILRQRYFRDPEVGRALATFMQGGAPSAWVDPLLYYYSAQNDETLRDIVLEVVAPRRQAGFADIHVEHVKRVVREWVTTGKTTKPWGETTILRVAQHALAALRDFGVLQGLDHKYIAPTALPVEPFAFLAFDLLRALGTGERVLHSPEWKLFFLGPNEVERLLLEAHQQRLLAYYAAGSVIRLEFPHNDLVELAHALVERRDS